MNPFLDYEDGYRPIVLSNVQNAWSLVSFDVTAQIHLIFYLKVVFDIKLVLVHTLQETCFISRVGASKIPANCS